jgi:hypothetical protein
VSIGEYADALADAIEAALPAWVVGSVQRVMRAWAGAPPPDDVVRAAEEAGQRAQAEIGGAVRALLEADIDDQRTTPLALLRTAVRYPTEVLRAAGVPAVARDRFAEEAFPDDIYGLSPASFAEVDPGLADVGISWGAAKAFEHKRRHRPPS